MLNKILKYAGLYKKSTHLASFIILLSVLTSILPFIFAYKIINLLIQENNCNFPSLPKLFITNKNCNTAPLPLSFL